MPPTFGQLSDVLFEPIRSDLSLEGFVNGYITDQMVRQVFRGAPKPAASFEDQLACSQWNSGYRSDWNLHRHESGLLFLVSADRNFIVPVTLLPDNTIEPCYDCDFRSPL